MEPIRLRRPISTGPAGPQVANGTQNGILISPEPLTTPRIRSRLILLAALVLGLVANWDAPSDCHSPPVALTPGSTANASIAVSAGKACPVLVTIGSTVIDDLTIEPKPRHGTVVVRGRTGVVYVPDANFRGEDAFGFSLRRAGPRGETSSVVVTATVN
jgi:hypothetical protein